MATASGVDRAARIGMASGVDRAARIVTVIVPASAMTGIAIVPVSATTVRVTESDARAPTTGGAPWDRG